MKTGTQWANEFASRRARDWDGVLQAVFMVVAMVLFCVWWTAV